MTPYQVYAIRYAHNDRLAQDNFANDISSDLHDHSMPLDFYVWAITNDERTVVVDLGFEHEGAARRGRSVSRLPSEGLAMLGIDATTVADVIVTHLHYDHAGDLASFPQATLHVQSSELAFATGPHMLHEPSRRAFDVEYVCDFVKAVYDERVAFVEGIKELAPGITLHHVGGHTAGHQVVRVWTESGWLVLASDAVHLYANKDERNPFPIIHDLDDMLAGYDLVDSLADDRELVIPGHDPQVLERFPNAFPGEIARLDQGISG